MLKNSYGHVALLVALIMQFVASVQGLPTVVSKEFLFEDKRAIGDSFTLGPRQNIPDGLAQFPAGPLNQFLRIISSLPQGERALDAISKILTPLQQSLATSAGINTSRDDMAQNAPCADMTVIFARGTTEPGNVGLVAGPPFFDALSEQLGDKSLSVQGVEYPATFAGFNQNGTNGVPSM
jgi:cutinase